MGFSITVLFHKVAVVLGSHVFALGKSVVGEGDTPVRIQPTLIRQVHILTIQKSLPAYFGRDRKEVAVLGLHPAGEDAEVSSRLWLPLDFLGTVHCGSTNLHTEYHHLTPFKGRTLISHYFFDIGTLITLAALELPQNAHSWIKHFFYFAEQCSS